MSNSKSTQTLSITASKSAFLRAQARLLSSPLQYHPQSSLIPTFTSPPVDRHNLDDPEHQDEQQQQQQQASLPSKVIGDLLTKINAKIKSHNRLVFSAQSQRHVAEQIDALYWSEVTDALKDPDHHNGPADSGGAAVMAGGKTVWIGKEVDFVTTTGLDIVRSLPDSLDELTGSGGAIRGRPDNHSSDNNDNNQNPGDTGGEDHQNDIDETDDDDDAGRYVHLRRQLLDLSERRDALRRKVVGCRRLCRLLKPLEDATVNVQPNLVTRDGELSRELERMRVLVARLEGGLSVRNQGGNTGGDDGLTASAGAVVGDENDDDGGGARPDTHAQTRLTAPSNREKLARVMELG